MDKMQIIRSVTDIHAEVSEQAAVVNGFLKVFNKRDVLSDLGGITGFLNVSMSMHFLKENVIFKALLDNPNLDAVTAEVVRDTLKEHEKFMEEFRELTEAAVKIDSGETELTFDFIKRCQYLIWALSKHAQVEDLVIFDEVAAKLSEKDFKVIENDLMNI